ncbi:hypothetical protein [Faecalibaculum rodentium]|uniref:hypothetical protein n=1 Tax=Faecalibaculum rodentium TaxID=1702221 RepID=UPI00272F8A47|nr:hypothetical protein [Faecalibaculum rodentium]
MTDIQKIVLVVWILGFVFIACDYVGQKIEMGGAYTIWILLVWTAVSAVLLQL